MSVPCACVHWNYSLKSRGGSYIRNWIDAVSLWKKETTVLSEFSWTTQRILQTMQAADWTDSLLMFLKLQDSVQFSYSCFCIYFWLAHFLVLVTNWCSITNGCWSVTAITPKSGAYGKITENWIAFEVHSAIRLPWWVVAVVSLPGLYMAVVLLWHYYGIKTASSFSLSQLCVTRMKISHKHFFPWGLLLRGW